ncbi:uncharacterized protein LOC132912767 isoform X1 [Bombus pascuorum]|uniref:uncharacterized protein LOC132912767 isoform X1 n=1 Tax=Bombus pascuorum TaxID=65598 RepID=UPI00298DFD11|nr:uncharacterized protein LOC132912767 isoform X1 [Bombus pascuorum]
MDRRGAFSISIVCLLIALVFASESETKQSGDTGNNPQKKTSLQTAEAASSPERRNASVSSVTLEDAIGPDSRGERERVERTETEQVEEDYEGEDEYEDELKAVAESHEAMSRDDTRNSNVSTAASTGLVDGTSSGSKNFDSREVITVNSSDEDVASNEAITDEIIDKYDQEVAELLKYKKERNSNHSEGNRMKTKRVPTVKKELSTQKEILIGSNETQVPKSLVPPDDPVNRLSEETDTIQRRNVGSNEPVEWEDLGYSERSNGKSEIVEHNRYSGSKANSPKKLDKRQETVLKDLKSYLLTEYANEEEQRQKLRELGAREDALVENLLELLVKIAENPSRWERVQKLLANTENELKLSRNELDPAAKRSYESTSTLFPTTSESSNDSRKSRKKLKKKKKPKHRFSTTTLTSIPATPPLLTTTETPWQTTPVHWRLVAERLFGPPWQQDLQGETEKTTSPRYSIPQSSRSLPSIRELIEQNKSKSNTKSFPFDRNPILANEVGELGNQRQMRFSKIGTRQPSHVQPHREFTNVYDRPTDPGRVPDYDIPETYHRLRYNQLSPASREFLGRREEGYQGDFNVQSDGFSTDQEYEPRSRDFALSKSWPDLSYGYNPPWRPEERPLLPISSEKWSWRQPSNNAKYWSQRDSFLPVEQNYWSILDNEEGVEQEAEAEKMWQQQRAQHSWNRDRSNWPVEKPMKVAPSWQQGERPMKLYDRDQANSVWEKGKNRSEPNKSSMKQESKEKVVLPQITMKTWNSLTSDPATWPHKLPGAKPWPKDENGKSYNPNADLVKKLGLDKQNSGAWSKEEAEKSNGERKQKDEKQSRLFSSKEEKLPQTEASRYKTNDDRSNFSDYKMRSGESMKSWTMLSDSKNSKDWMKTENMQGDDSGAWRRKYEGKNSWTDEAALPKIQSVGAWVMAADQSTWKPYQIKAMEPSDENTSRRWSKPLGRTNTEAKWTSKGSWPEKANDSWMDKSSITLWPDKTNVPEIWSEKSNKPGSWFAKTKDNAWASKGSNSDSWKVKGGEWLAKPESTSWISKMGDKNSWATRSGSWSTKSNESWTSKTNDSGSKFNEDSWPVKVKEEDSGDAWPKKSNEQNGWNGKGNELSPWQQKINDEWNYGKTSSTGTWPTKWKQFAYHRVTAMPISKPGTTADATSSKSKNAFVAVSAVSSPKYTGNEWRKNEEDPRNENGHADEAERTANQLQVGLERPIYAWKKDPGLRGGSTKSNSSDPLENQLEALRQIDFWPYKENEAEKRLASTSATTETTSQTPTNTSTTTTMHRRGGVITVNGLMETNRRTISMK